MAEVIHLSQEWYIGEQLREGGFGRVYQAQAGDGEAAVIKLVPKAPGADREILFEDLDGVPNVVPILDRGEWKNFWVLVMPKADKSLRDYLTELRMLNTSLLMTPSRCSLMSLKPWQQWRAELFIGTSSPTTYFYWAGGGVSQTLESLDMRKPRRPPTRASSL